MVGSSVPQYNSVGIVNAPSTTMRRFVSHIDSRSDRCQRSISGVSRCQYGSAGSDPSTAAVSIAFGRRRMYAPARTYSSVA